MAHPAKLHHAPPIGQVHHEAKEVSRVAAQDVTVTKIQTAVNQYLRLLENPAEEMKEAVDGTKGQPGAVRREHIHLHLRPHLNRRPHLHPPRVHHLNVAIHEAVVILAIADHVAEIHAAEDSQ